MTHDKYDSHKPSDVSFAKFKRICSRSMKAPGRIYCLILLFDLRHHGAINKLHKISSRYAPIRAALGFEVSASKIYGFLVFDAKNGSALKGLSECG